MRCEKARKIFSGPDADAPEVRRHMEQCRSCREWLGRVRRIEEIHRSLPFIEAPDRLTGRIMEEVAACGQERRRITWRILMPAAAAAFAVLGIYAGAYISDSMLSSPEPHFAETTGLEYFQAYPPESVGEALDLAARGEEDE